MSPDSIAMMLESSKERYQLMLPLLTFQNPYASDAIHYKIIIGLSNRCLKRNYNSFLRAGGLEQCRSDTLYRYMSSAFDYRGINLDVSKLAVEEEIVGLLSP